MNSDALKMIEQAKLVLHQAIVANKNLVNKLEQFVVQTQLPEKKAALLIGINYTDNPELQLGGCVNDVQHVRTALIEHRGVSPEHIVCLTDGAPGKIEGENKQRPTAENILQHIDAFVTRALKENFTCLWFHYSGHGTYITDRSDDEKDGRDECLVGCDGKLVSDDELLVRLVRRLPPHVKLTCVVDCCHSGTQMDLKYRYVGGRRNAVQTAAFSGDTQYCSVICLSGCRDNQTSDDVLYKDGWAGAMTTHILDILSDCEYNTTCYSVLRKLRNLLSANGHTQVPQITSTYKLNATTPFPI